MAIPSGGFSSLGQDMPVPSVPDFPLSLTLPGDHVSLFLSGGFFVPQACCHIEATGLRGSCVEGCRAQPPLPPPSSLGLFLPSAGAGQGQPGWTVCGRGRQASGKATSRRPLPQPLHLLVETIPEKCRRQLQAPILLLLLSLFTLWNGTY